MQASSQTVACCRKRHRLCARLTELLEESGYGMLKWLPLFLHFVGDDLLAHHAIATVNKRYEKARYQIFGGGSKRLPGRSRDFTVGIYYIIMVTYFIMKGKDITGLQPEKS